MRSPFSRPSVRRLLHRAWMALAITCALGALCLLCALALGLGAPGGRAATRLPLHLSGARPWSEVLVADTTATPDSLWHTSGS
jgi:hypothetical protein